MRVGTDVFAVAKINTCSLDLKHVEHQTRENICVYGGVGGTHRVDDTSAWRAARRLDGPHSRCLRRSSTWDVTQYYTRYHGDSTCTSWLMENVH